MQERLMNILVKLLKEIGTSGDTRMRLRELSEKLRGQGLSEREFTAALSWLTERLHVEEFESQEWVLSPRSVRVLHPVERMVLTPEAYGYLLHLENAGLIEKDQMEAVIEKAVSSGLRDVTVNDIKMITASLVFSPESSEWSSPAALWSDDDDTPKIQ